MENFRKKLAIFLFTNLFLFLVFGGFYIYFLKDISKSAKATVVFKEELASRSAILERIRALEMEYQASQPYFEKIKKSLPNETEVIALEGYLKEISRKRGVDLSFRFGSLNSPTPDEPTKSYSFNINLSGSIDDLINWFDDFEETSFTARFEQIELSQTSPGGQRVLEGVKKRVVKINPVYNVKILGRIYLR